MTNGICRYEIACIPGLTPWGNFFRPLRGLVRPLHGFPGLTPWAGFFRPLRGLIAARCVDVAGVPTHIRLGTGTGTDSGTGSASLVTRHSRPLSRPPRR